MPKAMISAAMETWWSGTFRSCMTASVIATVNGIAVATTSAERQSMRNNATITTITTASIKQRTK